MSVDTINPDVTSELLQNEQAASPDWLERAANDIHNLSPARGAEMGDHAMRAAQNLSREQGAAVYRGTREFKPEEHGVVESPERPLVWTPEMKLMAWGRSLDYQRQAEVSDN